MLVKREFSAKLKTDVVVEEESPSHMCVSEIAINKPEIYLRHNDSYLSIVVIFWLATSLKSSFYCCCCCCCNMLTTLSLFPRHHVIITFFLHSRIKLTIKWENKRADAWWVTWNPFFKTKAFNLVFIVFFSPCRVSLHREYMRQLHNVHAYGALGKIAVGRFRLHMTSYLIYFAKCLLFLDFWTFCVLAKNE